MQTLNAPVLVLNKSWVAVGTTTVRNGLCAIARGAAVGLCPESYQLYDWERWVDSDTPPLVARHVHSPSMSIPAPEVIILTNYDRLYAKAPAFSYRGLYARDGFKCQYCLKRMSARDLTVDHVVPRAKGGKTSWENCVASCLPCNQSKADRTPREAGLKLRKRPKQPRWNPTMMIPDSAYPESWEAVLGQNS